MSNDTTKGVNQPKTDGLDEAIERILSETYPQLHNGSFLTEREMVKLIKAGAEWMAGQGVSVDGKVIMDFSDTADIINRRLIAKLGDALLKVEPGDVIVQIRKK